MLYSLQIRQISFGDIINILDTNETRKETNIQNYKQENNIVKDEKKQENDDIQKNEENDDIQKNEENEEYEDYEQEYDITKEMDEEEFGFEEDIVVAFTKATKNNENDILNQLKGNKKKRKKEVHMDDFLTQKQSDEQTNIPIEDKDLDNIKDEENYDFSELVNNSPIPKQTTKKKIY